MAALIGVTFNKVGFQSIADELVLSSMGGRSLSASVVTVIVIIVVIVAGLAYIVVKYGSGAAPPPGPSTPGLLSSSQVSQYLGGTWTLNESESGVIYMNVSSGTATVRYLNGTTTTMPMSLLSASPLLPPNVTPEELTQLAMYVYVGTVNSQPYYLLVITYKFVNSTVASEIFNNISVQASQSGATSKQINGYPALYYLTSQGVTAVMLKDDYITGIASNITSATINASSWEGLLSSVLSAEP